MPRFLRILLTGSAFAGFFLLGGVIGRLLLPVILRLPGSPQRREHRRKRFLMGACRAFVGYMRALRLIHFQRPALPPGLPPPGQAYVVIANHPSLIDVLLLLSTFPGLTSLAKASWFRSWLLRPLLQLGGQIPGPDDRAQLAEAGTPVATDDTSPIPVLDRMVAHLRAGQPLLVFPEGSRSHERSLRRFRRGALEAAIRAEVPVVPVFISVAPAMLMKHQPWYEVPREGGHYTLEFLPILATAGRNLDARALNLELMALYDLRHAEMLRRRDALVAAPSVAALSGPQA